LRGDMTADEMREIFGRSEGLLPPTQIDGTVEPHQGLVREVDEQRRRCR
jgi:hypothetical protein